MDRTKVFNEFRPLMFSIAYRMLGTVMEAEDVLQDAYLRWQRVTVAKVERPKAYLSSLVTRLCIDYLRSARVQREAYIGPWLPEPLLTDTSANPDKMLMMSESLSTAFLVILESLKPIERAVFLLHDVFDYDYAEISEIVGKSEANCRQIASRARRSVAERRPRFETSPGQQSQAVEQFKDTLLNGDVDGLLAVLDKDVTWYSDGGGLPGIARKPIHGAEKVANFVLNLWRRAPANTAVHFTELNGRPGIIIYVAGRPFNTLSFEVVDGVVTAVYAVVNPDKLRRLPPLN